MEIWQNPGQGVSAVEIADSIKALIQKSEQLPYLRDGLTSFVDIAPNLDFAHSIDEIQDNGITYYGWNCETTWLNFPFGRHGSVDIYHSPSHANNFLVAYHVFDPGKKKDNGEISRDEFRLEFKDDVLDSIISHFPVPIPGEPTNPKLHDAEVWQEMKRIIAPFDY